MELMRKHQDQQIQQIWLATQAVAQQAHVTDQRLVNAITAINTHEENNQQQQNKHTYTVENLKSINEAFMKQLKIHEQSIWDNQQDSILKFAGMSTDIANLRAEIQ